MAKPKTKKPRKPRLPPDPNIGRVCKELRLGLDLKQQQLADLAKCEQSQVSRLEGGKRSVRLVSAIAIADALGVTVDTLIGRAPLAPSDDVYRGRAELTRTRDFQDAPAAVKARIMEVHDPAAASWSVVPWAHLFSTWSALAHAGKLTGGDERERMESTETPAQKFRGEIARQNGTAHGPEVPPPNQGVRKLARHD